MAKKGKNINQGVRLYNKILKEFTRVNNELPEERKLSLADRRKYIKDKIYPLYRGASASRVALKKINKSVLDVLDTISPKEGCDVNYISPSVYADIAWFELDDYISTILPKCIFIRIDAERFGATKIFNTLNYSYSRSGVRAIVENIREFVGNGTGIDISLTGVKKLKPKKPNDGTPENYFLDFVLVINSRPTKSIEPVVFNVPKENKKKVTSVKNAILARVKQLNLKKKRRKNARRTAIKNIKSIKELDKRQKKAKSSSYKKKLAYEKIKEFNKAMKQLELAYKRGNLTKEQYDKFFNEIQSKIFDAKKEGGIL